LGVDGLAGLFRLRAASYNFASKIIDGGAMSGDAPDLFGYSPAQGDLFKGKAPTARPQPRVDPDVIRLRLQKMLAEARAAREGSPWPPETTRLNQLIFPQMANWLPEEERDQLRLEFEAELKRLNLAA
jgi:hypothetical protein